MKTSEKIIRAKNIYIDCHETGMCACFEDAEYPILFNYYIAILFFGARIDCKGWFWWKPFDRDIRIKYFDWMIKTYKLFGR